MRQALIDGSGPFVPYLDLVRAIESESRSDYVLAAEGLMMGETEINRAVLRSLGTASQLG